MPAIDASAPLARALQTLLAPLVRLLLARGVAFDSFAEIARRTYVDVAETSFGIQGRKQTASRVSVLTGLTRKEVARIKALQEGERADAPASQRLNRAARVVSAWVRDFAPAGKSKKKQWTLPLEGARRSFAHLVREHSGDMPVRAVLDELTRTGNVVEREDGTVHLVNRTYLPPSDSPQKLMLLGADVADLISTIAHNLEAKPGEALFQRKTSYDNLPSEFTQALRARLAQEGQAFLENFDREMAQHDRDLNPQARGSGRKRAVLALYYYEQDYADDVAAKEPVARLAKRKQTKR
jgi:hypothetical protein